MSAHSSSRPEYSPNKAVSAGFPGLEIGSPLHDEDSTGNSDFGDLKKLVSKTFQAEINNLRDVDRGVRSTWLFTTKR